MNNNLSLLAALAVSLVLIGAAVCAATPTSDPSATHTQKAPVARSSSSKKASPYAPHGMPESARGMYATTWGVDQLSTSLTESGQLVRFSYRVIDTKKSAPLNEKASNPSLVDEKAHVALQVPNLEKVGPLRQSMPPENGKSYWMVFSNKGGHVKAGDTVSVVIGPVRLDGLVVQ